MVYALSRIPEPQWGCLLLREGREGPTFKGEEEGRKGERDHPKVQVSIIKHCPPMTTSNGKFYIFSCGTKMPPGIHQTHAIFKCNPSRQANQAFSKPPLFFESRLTPLTGDRLNLRRRNQPITSKGNITEIHKGGSRPKYFWGASPSLSSSSFPFLSPPP